jgi:hypothetical protein
MNNLQQSKVKNQRPNQKANLHDSEAYADLLRELSAIIAPLQAPNENNAGKKVHAKAQRRKGGKE